MGFVVLDALGFDVNFASVLESNHKTQTGIFKATTKNNETTAEFLPEQEKEDQTKGTPLESSLFKEKIINLRLPSP